MTPVINTDQYQAYLGLCVLSALLITVAVLGLIRWGYRNIPWLTRKVKANGKRESQ